MAVALTALVALHGAIHALGFLKWSRLARVPQLGDRTLIALSGTGERIFAVGWLLAVVLFLVAAGLRSTRQDAWWMAALAGVLLSQGLVVLAWPDAKAGTAANIIVLVAALAAAAHARFVDQVRAEAQAVLAQASPSETAVVQRAELDTLPAPVRRWLETSGLVGRPRAATVRLRQRGELRTKADGRWMPAQAEQYFSVDPPAFVWRVDATMMAGLPIAGRDKYTGGHGQMLIKAASLVNVVNAADEKIDLGSMLRYLGEIIWFPSAALSRHVAWEPIDTGHAKATLRYAGSTVSAVFTFDERGRVVRFGADRYLGGGNEAQLTPWFASCSEWRSFEGIEVPSRGEVGWMLPGGPFIYYRWEILDVQVNRTDLYPGKDAPRFVQPAAAPAAARVGKVSR